MNHERNLTHNYNHLHSVKGVINYITDNAYFSEEIDLVVKANRHALYHRPSPQAARL